MSNRFWQKPRRVTAGLVAGALASLAAFAASPAGAIVSTNYPPNADADRIIRLYGLDRYETSVQIAQVYNLVSPSTQILVASGEKFPDALTAAALAGKLKTPTVLVPASGTLPAVVAAYITNLTSGASGTAKASVTIVGGTASVGTDIAAAIQALGTSTPTRVAGADRYVTSRQVAANVGPAASAPDIAAVLAGTSPASASTYPTVLIASGEEFPDALAAGALASDGFTAGTQHPIILTAKNSLPAASVSALLATGAKQAIVVGGPNSISDAVLTLIKTAGVIKVVRIAGADRYATAAALNGTLAGLGVFGSKASGNAPLFTPPLNTLPSTSGNVAVANFAIFPDALSAGPALGLARAALFGSGSLPTSTVAALNGVAAGKTQNLWVIGGQVSVPDADALGALVAIDSTKLPATAKPVLLSGSQSLAATTQASVTVGASAGLNLLARASVPGVAGNDWKLELQDTNPVTVQVTLDTAGKRVIVNGDLDGTTGTTLTADAAAVALQANTSITDLFTVSGSGTLPGTTSFNFLKGGTSTLSVKATFSLTLVSSPAPATASFTYQAKSAVAAITSATATVDSSNKQIVNLTFPLTGTSQAPVPFVSELTAKTGAVTASTTSNTNDQGIVVLP